MIIWRKGWAGAAGGAAFSSRTRRGAAQPAKTRKNRKYRFTTVIIQEGCHEDSCDRIKRVGGFGARSIFDRARPFDPALGPFRKPRKRRDFLESTGPRS